MVQAGKDVGKPSAPSRLARDANGTGAGRRRWIVGVGVVMLAAGIAGYLAYRA
jgi:Protein of unknown function (DUF3105)